MTRVLAVLSLAARAALAQSSETLVVNADQGRDTISRHVYGHFAEHLGRGLYDGIFARGTDGAWHARDDVVRALRAIHLPNLRWPGGCYADYYHWRDGVGPRGGRPTIVNNTWGGVTEDNGIGTHEFLALAAALGAEPFLVGNLGSGTVQEMHDWWEYVNHPGKSPMADLRRANGRDSSWNVRFWGLGNESWGCGGAMRPEYYADEFRRYASFLPAYGKVRPFRIATGPYGTNYEWTETLMRQAGSMIDGLDLHYYVLTGSWEHKGKATEFSEAEWAELMKKALDVEDVINRHATIMDRYDPEKRVWLIVGEWGTWHEVEAGTNPGFLYQQNSLRDALAAAVMLDVFNRHADRVKMANIAQMVNVLQSMVLTRGEQMVLTPTYHVFEMYTVHHDAALLPSVMTTGRYEYGGRSMPAVSATASRDSAGRIHITMTNLDPHRERTVKVAMRGQRVAGVSGRVLTAAEMSAHNTFERPDVVKPAPFAGATLGSDGLTVRLPAKSVVVLELR